MRSFAALIMLILPSMAFGRVKNVRDAKPYCEVSDQAAHFNFTVLSESPKDRIIVDTASGETIRLRLCGPLREPCNGLHNYGICLKKQNVEVGIGKSPPDSVTADSGQLKFQFSGDNCDGDKKYTVHVMMRCSYEAGYDSQPELIPRQTDRCTFYMVWNTKAACGAEHVVNCTAIDKDDLHYDLSSLVLTSDNYVAPVTGNSDAAIVLNVCHSVLYDYGAVCHPGAGACLRELDKAQNKTVYKNLGYVKDPPFFDNGVLTLKYGSGHICVAASKADIETVISFECDHRATHTMPEYEGGADDCIHRFRWKTAAACSVESLKNQSSTTAEICKVTDPLSNIEYNFRELLNQDFRAKSANGTIYNFQICGPTLSESCPTGAGSCDVKKKISMGRANTNLMWSRGGPYLNYTDGDECGGGKRRYTEIGFFCGPNDSTRAPIVTNDKECGLLIHWNTPMICDETIKCETNNGEISLTSLIRSRDNYVVRTNDTEIMINVCRSLVPEPYLTCMHGSAACRRGVSSSDDQFLNEISLGFPDKNPFVDEKKRVVLRYTEGSPCPENRLKALSSNLTFICDHSISTGAPILKNYRNCTYVFEWATSVVCEKIEARWTTGCVIENPRSSQNIDLTSLGQKIFRNVTSKFGHRYNVNLCGDRKYCNGSVVCTNDDNYGSPSGVTLDYGKNAIVLKFSGGSRCKNGTYSSEVKLICDENAKDEEPKIVEPQSSAITCSVAFEWRTQAACAMRSKLDGPASGDSGAKETMKNVTDDSESHVVRNIGIGGIVIVCVAMIIYLCWSPVRRARLRNRFESLTGQRERCRRAQYTKVNATEEATLLLDDVGGSTQCQTNSDSDDELIDA